ncbi:MAG: MBL fold metallo-hydrolase [Phycisphaerae bacterium]|nr:MBL fold metallo-hydrolase [Phycisphaerae bacterium]
MESFTLGPYETNCYVVWADSLEEKGSPSACWIVDASFDPAPMIASVRRRGLKPEALILTHAHVDHIAGVNEVTAAFPRLPVWIHADESAWLADPMRNLSALGGVPITARGPDRLLRDGDMLNLGTTHWRVLHTPGHSPGGLTLWCEEEQAALVGDALFAGSVGRTDLPGGDPRELARSIRERLYTLPPQTRVMPGHGPETTIGRERMSNPFVRG